LKQVYLIFNLSNKLLEDAGGEDDGGEEEEEAPPEPVAVNVGTGGIFGDDSDSDDSSSGSGSS